jgi:hypothetical protein
MVTSWWRAGPSPEHQAADKLAGSLAIHRLQTQVKLPLSVGQKIRQNLRYEDDPAVVTLGSLFRWVGHRRAAWYA